MLVKRNKYSHLYNIAFLIFTTPNNIRSGLRSERLRRLLHFRSHHSLALQVDDAPTLPRRHLRPQPPNPHPRDNYALPPPRQEDG
jgi:hypothetical protein